MTRKKGGKGQGDRVYGGRDLGGGYLLREEARLSEGNLIRDLSFEYGGWGNGAACSGDSRSAEPRCFFVFFEGVVYL